MYQTFSAADVSYGAGIWVKALAAGDVGKKLWLYLFDTANRGQVTITLTADWQYITTSATLTSGTRSFYLSTLGSDFGGSNQAAVSALVWGAHLYRSDLGGMQANASAYPMYNPSTPRNLLGWSEAFDNAAWNKSNVLAFGSGSVANAIAAPNGSLSADLLIPNTTSGTHSVSITGSTLSTFYASVYARAGGYSKIAIRESSVTGAAAAFNLSTGTVIDSYNAGVITVSEAAITPVGDGWYRISCKMTSTSASSFNISIVFVDPAYTSGSPFSSWTPDGTSGIYLWGAQLSDSASLDPYVGSYGAAPSAAAAHGPRLDYDPVTLAARGLLVEESATNLLTRTEEFDNAGAWTPRTSSISSNAVSSPTGTLTADTVLATAGSGFHYVNRTNPLTLTGAHTFSVYVRKGTSTWIFVTVNDSGLNYFNLDTGEFGTVADTCTRQAVGNGWYRLTVTRTLSAALANCGVGVANANGGGSFNAVGTESVYVWGAQLEAKSFATSYLPNVDTGAGVTRNADVASVATSQFPYSASEGTLVAAFDFLGGSAANSNAQSAVSLWQSSGNQITLYNGDGVVAAYCAVSSATQAYMARSAVAANTVTKAAFAFKANDFAASQDGGAVATDTTGSLPSPTTLAIGNSGSPSAYISGHIRQITYIPRRLTNAELQARTV
jgi:hypothetical protein